LIDARRTRDRGRVGTVATRSTGTTRGAGGASTGVSVRPRRTGLTHCAVALNGKCISITRNTRTSDQPVTGVTGGCDLIGARRARDRCRVGTVATRSTGLTRGAGGASTGVSVRS
jgi:hypothetical protein